MTGALAIGAIAVLALAGALAFNRLVRHRNLVREAWSGIDVQLKRRHDLVPNLVESVRGHATFERTVLEEVTRLRGAPRASRALQDGENALTTQLRGLLAVAEAYPQLRAGESFLGLQQRLTEVENQLQMARRYYNGTVRDLNTAVQSFPAVLIAGPMGFREEPFYEIEDRAAAQIPPKVSF